MSKGAGRIERRIADLFRSTPYHALSIDEITRHAFALADGATPSRAQRLSATRATHRMLKRVHDWVAQAYKIKVSIECSSDPMLDVEAERLMAKAKRLGCWLQVVRTRQGQSGKWVSWSKTVHEGRLVFYRPRLNRIDAMVSRVPLPRYVFDNAVRRGSPAEHETASAPVKTARRRAPLLLCRMRYSRFQSRRAMP